MRRVTAVVQMRWASGLALAGLAAEPLRRGDGQLLLQKPILPLTPAGLLDVPRNSTFLIDVGMHYQSTLLPRLADPSVILIGFEPDSAALALSEATLPFLVEDWPSRQSRFFRINAAVGRPGLARHRRYVYSESPDPAAIEAGRDIGLGSLREAADPRLKAMHTQVVPVVSLRSILAVLPGDVELLKVDAQGMDLDVVLSGRPQLHRVRRIHIETQSVGANETVYAGQRTTAEITRVLERLGFRREMCARPPLPGVL